MSRARYASSKSISLRVRIQLLRSAESKSNSHPLYLLLIASAFAWVRRAQPLVGELGDVSEIQLAVAV